MAWGITELGLSQKEKDKYSLNRALAAISHPHNASLRKDARFELDLSNQICKRDGRETNGFIIPQEIMENPYRSNVRVDSPILTQQAVFGKRWTGKRAMVSGTDASGGYLVDTEIQGLVQALVANNLALQNVPAFTVKGNPVDFPGQASKVAPTAKGETAAADESNPTFTEVEFTTKRLTSKTIASRTILLQSNEDLEAFIRNRIAIAHSRALDSAMFYGATNGPTGIKSTTGIVSKTWAATKVYERVLDTWADIGVNNIPSRNLKWFTSWRFCHDGKRAQKMNDYSHLPVIDKDGTIDGVPVEVSSQIVGTNTQKAEGFMADWMEAALVLWQDLEIEIDPYSLLDKNQVRFIGQMLCDFNVLRPKAFGRLGGA